MDPVQRAEHEGAIVRTVAANVADVMDGEWEDREWLHLFVDIEVGADPARSSSITFAIARRPQGAPEQVAFRLPREAKQLFGELAEGMGTGPGSRWTSAQLRIARGGRYTIDYLYDPPYRLGGNLIDKRFSGYLEHWLKSEEAAACLAAPGPAKPAPAARSWWRRLGLST